MTRSMTCVCQAVITAEDTESLIAPVKDHFDQEHPDYLVSTANVRNTLESEDRATGPTEALEKIGPLEFVPIAPGSAEDVGRFFDVDAFPDNPWWGACYCMFFPRGGRQNENWGEEPWQDNRSDQMARIRSGKTTGMLAYADGKLVGWCNATARSELPSLATGDDAGVASVVCFVVSPPYRGHGVATGLLDGVVRTFQERDFERLEAYPVKDASDHRKAFHGTVDLFSSAGFTLVSEEPLVMSRDLP
jgi:GNAT superfamily N-acetyltransferase